MSKSTKIWLVTATLLVVVGVIIFSAVMFEYDWDLTKLNTEKYETNTHEIAEDFNGISLDSNTADIILAMSDDEKCRVECYEEEKAKHSVVVQDDTLVVKVTDRRSWYDYIGISFDSPRITIYLPKTEYASIFVKDSTGDVEIPKEFKFEDADITLSTGDINFFASVSDFIKIKTSTGDIRIENASAGKLELSSSTGKITLSDIICEGDVEIGVSTGKTSLNGIECKNVISCGSTGDISLKNVIASEKFSLERSTGDITFENSDADEIFVQTDTGDVTGTLLSEKVFIISTDTGDIDVPESVSGGRCEITTSTGDVYFKR